MHRKHKTQTVAVSGCGRISFTGAQTEAGGNLPMEKRRARPACPGKEEKDFFGNLLTPYNIITRKPIVPSDEETESNSRARSAKLRIAERK